MYTEVDIDIKYLITWHRLSSPETQNHQLNMEKFKEDKVDQTSKQVL